MIIHIGNNVYVDAGAIRIIMASGTTPAKKLVEEAKKKNKFFDVSGNKKRRGLVVMSDGTTFLAIVKPETLFKRIKGEEKEEE